jgi:error-prone DNA polymerase
LVAHHLADLSAELASVGDREESFPLPHGRGDEFHHGSPAPDPRGLAPKGSRALDANVLDLRVGSAIIPGQPTDGIKIKPRDFR